MSRLAEAMAVYAGRSETATTRTFRLMQQLLIALACAAVFLPPAVAEAESADGDAKRLQQHPRILTIRKIYQDVTRELAAGRLQVQVRRFESCEPYSEGKRVLAREKQSVVRRYERESASDDSFVRETFYYDDRGQLAFLLVTANAVNGTRVEYRLYFEADGSTLHEDRRMVRGPGYTFPEQWPAERRVHDPYAAFSEKNPCRERHGP